MSSCRPVRLSAIGIVFVAAVLALGLFAPSVVHPQASSAQCYTYGCSSTCYTFSSQCNPYSNYNGYNSGCTYSYCNNTYNSGCTYSYSYGCNSTYNSGCTYAYSAGCTTYNSGCTYGYSYGCNTYNSGCTYAYSAGCTTYNSGCTYAYSAGCNTYNSGCTYAYSAGCTSNCYGGYSVGCTNNCSYGSTYGCTNGLNCPAGTYSNGSSCVSSYNSYNNLSCPAGTYSNGSTCVSSYNNQLNCGVGSYSNGSTCVTGGYGTGGYGTGTCTGITLAAGQACSNGIVTCQGSSAPVSPGQSCAGVGVGVGVGAGACTQYSSTTGQCVQYASAATSTGSCTQYSSTTGQCIQYASTANSVTTSAGQVSCPNGGTASSLANCPASTQLTTCSVGGAQVTSQSQCPQQCANGQILPPAASCSSTTSTSSTSSASSGATVTYKQGWNLISGPGGTTPPSGVNGSIYTFQSGDTNYETMAASTQFKSGLGYWALFSSNQTVTVPLTTAGNVSIPLPAGQPVMIGNSGSTTATLSGADHVYIFDPASNNYGSATTLSPGQGAWAESDNGGSVTISNASS